MIHKNIAWVIECNFSVADNISGKGFGSIRKHCRTVGSTEIKILAFRRLYIELCAWIISGNNRIDIIRIHGKRCAGDSCGLDIKSLVWTFWVCIIRHNARICCTAHNTGIINRILLLFYINVCWTAGGCCGGYLCYVWAVYGVKRQLGITVGSSGGACHICKFIIVDNADTVFWNIDCSVIVYGNFHFKWVSLCS